jgi:hypothetical protein
MLRLVRPLSVALLAVVIAGCAARARNIADIRDDPGRYDNRQVVVTGRVTSAWSVPLMPYALYKIDDGTAEITVLSQRRGGPARGALVRVRGHVREVANFGANSVGLHIQERDRDTLRR